MAAERTTSLRGLANAPSRQSSALAGKGGVIGFVLVGD